MKTIYTSGYLAGWTPETLKTTCEELGALLLDIRYSPHSRRPEWDRAALRNLFGQVRYRHEPALGNRNYNNGKEIALAAPEHAVDRLRVALKYTPVVLLCACREATACHRSVAAAFLAERLGAEVVHLDAPVAAPAPGTWKVLSLTQPWATLVALGAKRIETRSWATSYRGPLLIHAAKGLGPVGGPMGLVTLCVKSPFVDVLTECGITLPELPRGAIVAACELQSIARVEHYQPQPDDADQWSGSFLNFGNCGEMLPGDPELSFGDYTIGRYAWKLTDIRALPEPIPARGMPGLWDWTGEIGL
jgi:hypothetical protein